MHAHLVSMTRAGPARCLPLRNAASDAAARGCGTLGGITPLTPLENCMVGVIIVSLVGDNGGQTVDTMVTESCASVQIELSNT